MLQTLASDTVLDHERVFREVAPALWRAIYAYSAGRRDIADEAVAEAFVRAIRSRVAIRSARSWLYRTAFRIAAAELRREAQLQPFEATGFQPEPEFRDILFALRKLSPSQRAAVFLRYEADLPVREVARLMGSTEAAVRVHLFRGRHRLRLLLGEEEEDA